MPDEPVPVTLKQGFPPALPQYNRFGIQDIDRISHLILADCFSGNIVNANGTDIRSSGGSIVQFFYDTSSGTSF